MNTKAENFNHNPNKKVIMSPLAHLAPIPIYTSEFLYIATIQPFFVIFPFSFSFCYINENGKKIQTHTRNL